MRWPHFRTVIGATDPAEAAPGTIRKLYAESKGRNAVHGSDSDENAAREIGFFFSEGELAGPLAVASRRAGRLDLKCVVPTTFNGLCCAWISGTSSAARSGPTGELAARRSGVRGPRARAGWAGDGQGQLQATGDGEYLWRGRSPRRGPRRVPPLPDRSARRRWTWRWTRRCSSTDPEAADDPDFYPLSDRAAAVDVRTVVREELALAAHAYLLLCREDCAGLCPRCGADLNAGPCACHTPAEPV